MSMAPLTVADLLAMDRGQRSPPPEPPAVFVVGLDLGQAQDYTAWVVGQMREAAPDAATYDIVHIDRVRGATYPTIVEHTRHLVGALRARDPRPVVDLVVDYTGVGRAVADLLEDADLRVPVTLVTITGGDSVTRGERGEQRIPKRDLAAVVQVCLQGERLRIAADLPLATILTDELVTFRVKISLGGHDSYGAGADWRDGHHDDLVLALALALWHGENRVVPRIYI